MHPLGSVAAPLTRTASDVGLGPALVEGATKAHDLLHVRQEGPESQRTYLRGEDHLLCLLLRGGRAMRVWLVTARDEDGKFIDQRRIEAPGRGRAERDAYDWIRSKGGVEFRSTLEEIT
jgi:hypothetical protein